jgi:hypothetical protein
MGRITDKRSEELSKAFINEHQAEITSMLDFKVNILKAKGAQ